ncbi:NUDIX hydrolase [Micromonospora echinospora]|uniref:NUDIX hydrolase n=1 Tax=Micromonospora echinospora TaxID=1877 RepID=UPI003F4CB128
MRTAAPGAGLAIVTDALLLIRRHRFITDTWGWEIPQGSTRDGEDPATAAVREAEEETGWRTLPHRRLADIDARMEQAAAKPVVVPETIVTGDSYGITFNEPASDPPSRGVNFTAPHQVYCARKVRVPARWGGGRRVRSENGTFPDPTYPYTFAPPLRPAPA